MELQDRLAALVAGFSGTCGLYARNLTGAGEVALNAHQPFPPASTIKLPVLYELFRQFGAGLLSPDETVVLTAAEQVGGSGVLKDLAPGVTMTLRDAATLMITVSDNTATNLCIERTGTGAVNATAHALGLARTVLNRKINRELERPLGHTTAADLGLLLQRIWAGAGAPARPGAVGPQSQRGADPVPAAAYVAPEGCAAMLEILSRQQVTFLTRDIPDFFPPDGEPEARIASKSGWVPGTRNDAGLIWGPRAVYAVAIMTGGCADRRYHPDNEGILLLNRLSAEIYRAWAAA